MFAIAGVTGHVGSKVAEDLLAAGESIEVLVRDAAKGERFAERGAEVAVLDLGDRKALAAALEGASGFFCLLPPDYAAEDFYAYQCRVADAIAGAVADSGVPHVVLLSSIGADVAEGTGPIRGLYYLENELRETGAVVSAMRPAYFQENVGALVRAARHAGIVPNFGVPADVAYPMIATRDIGAAVAAQLRSPPPESEAVDLLGPSYTTRQVADVLGEALGKKLEVVDLERDKWAPTLVGAGFPTQVAELFAEMYDAARRGVLAPRGDRQIVGDTALADTVETLVAA